MNYTQIQDFKQVTIKPMAYTLAKVWRIMSSLTGHCHKAKQMGFGGEVV